MSLVNRMLKDLSAREPTGAGVMQGIRIEASAAPGRRRGLAWILLLLLAIGGGGWWFSQKLTVPASPTVAPTMETAQPAATPPSAPPATSRFVLDETLAAVPAPRTASPRDSVPAAAAPAPARRAEAAKAPPAGKTPPSRSAAERFADGKRALERGDSAGAEQLWTEALAQDEKFHPAREQLGNLRVRQERWDEAERYVRRGLEVAPDWVGYRRLAGRLELARNRPAEARALLERQPPAVADDPEYNGLLASAYQRVSDHEQASRLYRTLANQQPEQGHWWAGYAISREALGDTGEARRAYAQALQDRQLDPRVSRYVQARLEALKPKAG